MNVSGSSSSDFQMPEPGTYVAPCIKLVDLGTGEYQGKPRRQIAVEWELPTELIEGGEWDGQPMTVRSFYSRTLFEGSNLRRDLVNWRGKDFSPEELDCFNLSAILGAPCMLTLSATETGRRKVTAVSKLMKGTSVPPQVNPSVEFDLEDFSPDTYAGLSSWFQDTIAKSPEYKAVTAGARATAAAPGDDVAPW